MTANLINEAFTAVPGNEAVFLKRKQKQTSDASLSPIDHSLRKCLPAGSPASLSSTEAPPSSLTTPACVKLTQEASQYTECEAAGA